MRVVLLLLLSCVAVGAAFAQAPGDQASGQEGVYVPFVSTSSPGRIAYVSDDVVVWTIHTVNGDGTGDTVINDSAIWVDHPSWSADGKQIAFEAEGQDSRLSQVYIMQHDGSGVKQITEDPGTATQPAWSPDGSRIAFVTMRDGYEEIYVMDPDGSNQARLTNNPAADFSPSWSPDSSRILFSSTRDGNVEIYSMLANGSDVTRLTTEPANDNAPAWSPNGLWIAFCSQRGETPGIFYPPDLYLMKVDGSGVVNITNTNQYSECQPTWSSDSTQIAFTATPFPPQSPVTAIFTYKLGYTGTQYLAGLNRYAGSPDWTR